MLSNFVSLSVLRGFQFLIPLITFPYLVRTIGIENFGLVNFALSVGLYFGAVIQFGFGITSTREIARNRDDSFKLAKIYSTTLSATILLALFCILIFALILLSFDRFNDNVSIYIYTLAFIVLHSLFPIWFFQGMEKMKYITVISFITSVIFILCLFVFVTKESDFILVPLLNAFAAFLTLIMSFLVIKKQFKVAFVLPTTLDVFFLVKSSFNAFISQFAPNLYNNTTTFMLGMFQSYSAVGLYSAATKVIDAVISLSYILSSAFFPYLSRDLKNHHVFQKIMIGSGLGVTLAIFFLAGWITELLFDEANNQVIIYIQYLSISIFLIFVSTTYSTNYLMLIGKERLVRNITLFTSILYFFVAIIAIPLLGVWGAIITLVGARLTMAILQFTLYLRYRNQRETV